MKRKSLLFLLLFALLAPWAANAQQTTLTVYDEGTTTNNYVPIYGLYCDEGVKCEFVIPAEQLAEMTNGTISAMKFYLASVGSSTIEPSFTIFVKEVNFTTMTAYTGTTDATTVFNSTFTFTTGATNVEIEVPFSENYTYEGGNLLIGVYQNGTSGYSSLAWTGVSQDYNSAWRGYGSSTGSAQQFLPKTTFTYTAGASDCDMPTAIAVSNVTADGATVTWEGDGDKWNLRYKASADADFTLVENLTTASYTLSSLQGNTTYSVGVQTVCTGSTSFFKSTSFTTENPCAAPTNFVASNITGSSATLSWTAGYQETAWTVKYKKSADSWDNATTVSVSGTPTTNLTGLDGLTVYNVRVFNCTGENDPYLSGNFTTAASFPYSQDFSGSTSIPTGWALYSGLLANVMTGTALTTASYGWSNGTSNGVLDGNHIYANIYSTGCSKWVVTPAIPVESGARLTFDVAYTAYSGTAVNPAQTGTDDKFVVLASTDNMATWTILRQWDNAGSEFVLNELTPATLHQIFDLADYAGQNVIVAFYGESTESNADNNIHVDNVVFELTPSCEKPLNLAVNYTGGLTAEVSWTSDASSWNLMVNGTQINNITENPYTLTNLSLSTTYNVAVQANCSGSSSEWTTPVSFTTDICLPEDMCELTFVLNDSYGDGWNNAYIAVVDVETEMELARMSADSHGGGNVASTDTKTLSVCDGREIQFVWHSGNYDSECSFEIKDINGEVIANSISALPVNYTVNCTVTSCRKPTDLAATDIFGHSAKLSWTENGEATEWVIDYNGTTLTVNENPYVLEGLVPETAYTVKVKPVCDEEKWSDEITFTTAVACPAPTFEVEAAAESATITIAGEAETYNVRYRTPRGFNYGFEQAEAWVVDSFDPCTTYDGDQTQCYGFEGETISNIPFTGSTIAFQNNGTNMVAHTGNAFGLMVSAIPSYYPEGVTHSDDWFILPELTIERGYVFSFWGREITTQYGEETINVGIYGSTDGTFASYLENGEAISVGTTTWEKYTFDLSEYAGQTIRLAINYVSDDIFGFMFDDIFVGNPEDDTWDYTFNEVNSPYEITGLTSETEYEVQVQANCGEDGVSAWSATVVFMTKPLCEVPTNVAVADITTNSAVVTWESEATSFDIEVNGEVTEDVTSPYTLNDLDPGTAYSVRVRANCGETGYSAWTTAVEFLTSCLAYDLPYEYGFETADDMNCWSVMAANSANLLGRINITAQEIEDFAAYEGDYGFVFSSYNQADAYQQVLMSPELNSGDAEVAFEFYYRAYGGGTEEVYVLYSTTTNDLEEFEMADAIEADNTDEWLQYQTTLPAGTKYVALYYNSNFQYYLFVDGFKFEEATGATQVLELSAGWNNISVYLAVEDPVAMLDQLKEGLGANALWIEGSEGYTEYDGEEWFGDLDDMGITNGQSYMINVEADCTVELQGMPANPADYAISITPGWNRIGFPSAEELEISVALGDFPAEEGDMLEGPEGYTEFDGEEWFGDIDMMVPGHGYMYLYSGEGEATLVIQTGAKTRRVVDATVVKDVKDLREAGSDMPRKQAMVIKTVKK